jgi:N-acetylglutamate synthase-like GNAT family acetyltransferase
MKQSASQVQIRKATAEDAPLVASILRQAFAEYEPLYTTEAYAATTPKPDEVRIRMQEGPVWVALHDGHIVGTVSAVLKPTGVYVRGMAVRPASSGLGIGHLLLETVESFAAASGCKRLFLSTTPFLSRAIRLYEAAGFQRTSDGPHDLFDTPLFTMERLLCGLVVFTTAASY